MLSIGESPSVSRHTMQLRTWSVDAKTASYATIILVIVGAFGFLSLSSQLGLSGSSSVTVTYGNLPSTFYSPVSPSGLRLQILLNTTSMAANGALKVQVELYNTLSVQVQLAVPGSEWEPIWWTICRLSPVEGLFTFGVFYGHLTAANSSEGWRGAMLPQPVVTPPDVMCPPLGHIARQLEFAPQSMNADDQGATIAMQLNYATPAGVLSSPAPGVSGILPYTVIARDVLNQTVYAYFEVLPSSAGGRTICVGCGSTSNSSDGKTTTERTTSTVVANWSSAGWAIDRFIGQPVTSSDVVALGEPSIHLVALWLVEESQPLPDGQA